MERARRLQIRQLCPELTCHLCHGYFVDAFTVVECMHSCKEGEGELRCPRVHQGSSVFFSGGRR